MSTPVNPSGEPPTTNDSDTSVGVQDPHEHHWFSEPTKEVGPKYVAALVFAQFVFFQQWGELKQYANDRGIQLIGRDLVALRGTRRDDHRRATAILDDIGIGDPVRRRNDDLVTRLDRRHQRIEQRVLAANVHADLTGLIAQAVVALELGGDRRLQFGRAVDIGIFGLARADRLDCGVLDEIGRIEIGLAGGQADHRYTLRFQLQNTGGHSERRRRADAAERGRDEAHRSKGLSAEGS